MSEHSPEAIAAYPYNFRGDDANVDRQRTAFDRGRALKLTATREQVVDAVEDAQSRWAGDDETDAMFITDAILAAGIVTEPGKPVVDREALAEQLQRFTGASTWAEYAQKIIAAGIVTEPGKPVVDRGALAKILFHRARQNALSRIGLTETDTPHVNWEKTDRAAWYEHADAILASGILRDEREVKAEALEELADIYGSPPYNDDQSAQIARQRAAEIREGAH